MAFSGTVKISGLNDFLAPAQDCVVAPVKTQPSGQPKIQLEQETKEPTLILLQQPNLIKQKQSVGSSSKVAAVSLADCLACSGCVTSAETVLLEQHSLQECEKALNSAKIGGKPVVFSLSPQTIASLSQYFGIFKSNQMYSQIRLFLLGEVGAADVFSMEVGIALALIETMQEFKGVLLNQDNSGNLKLPLLVSECPGWICYAEKTQGEILFPHMSRVKSPQQINGVLLKSILQREQVYHIAVAPCYDKKLEALHSNLVAEKNPALKTGQEDQVDLVLTTTQLLQLLEAHQFKLEKAELIQPQQVEEEEKGEACLLRALQRGHEAQSLGALFGASSNGYAQFISHSLSSEYGVSQGSDPLFTPVRKKNQELKTAFLPGPQGSKLQIAKSYSFRNLTNVVRKVKSSKCDYAFIQMMACPGGCLNGGGQIKPKSNSDAKSLLRQIEASLQSQRIEKPDWSFQNLKGAIEYVQSAVKGSTWFKTEFIETGKNEASPFRLDW